MRIQCPHCSKTLRVADEMAGKRIKCPSCGQACQLPPVKPGDGPKPAGEPQAPPRREANPAPPPAPAAEAPSTVRDCPKCGAAMAPQAVLCTDCGYNTQTGDQVVTSSTPRATLRLPRIPIRYVLLVLVVAGAVVAILSLKGKPPTGPHPAKLVIVNMMDAADKGDVEPFVKCFKATPEQADMLRSIITIRRLLMTTVERIHRDRPEGLRRPHPLSSLSVAGVTQPIYTAMERDRIRRATWDRSADEVRCVSWTGAKPIRIVPGDGGWLIDASDFLPAGTEIEAYRQELTTVQTKLQKIQDLFGDHGVPEAEKVRSDLLPDLDSAQRYRSAILRLSPVIVDQ